MAVEYGWDGSSWVPLTSAPPSSAEVWGEHLVTWDGTLWHYRGATIVDRPEANYAEGSRVLWDTSQDVAFTDPPPLMVSGDLWIPHEEISSGGGGGAYLPLTGGTLTGQLFIEDAPGGVWSLDTFEINVRNQMHIDAGGIEIEDGNVRVWNGGLLVTGSVVNEIEALIEAWGGVMLPNPPVNPTDAVNKSYADSLVMSGPQGPQGPPGVALLNAQWNFNQNTAVSPASGTMRMNATTFAAVTYLWIHETDRDGLDRTAGLDLTTVGDQIIMQSAQGRSVWNVTSHADSGVYRTFGVTLVESTGTRPSASSPTTIYIMSSSEAAGGHTIQDEGTARTARAGLNFIGPAVVAADDSGNDRTNVTISTPNILVLGPVDPVPGGTPAGTVIIRTA